MAPPRPAPPQLPSTGRRRVHFPRWTRWTLAATALSGIGVYTYFAVLYYGSHVNVAHHYAAETDAKAAAAVPGGAFTDSNRAWPVLKRLQKQLSTVDITDKSWPHPKPGSDGWKATLAVLAEHPTALEELRAAAERPSMGHLLSGDEDPDDPASTGIAGARDVPLLATLMPYLGCARNGARWLMFDLDVAVHERDPARAAADIRAALSLAALCESQGQLIEQLVRIAIAAMVIDNIATLIADNPGFLSDAQLADLRSRIDATVGPDRDVITLDFERLIQLDQAQRTFTDDGHGDGHLCADGEEFLQAMAGGSTMSGPELLLHRIFAPVLVDRWGTRRQYIATFDQLSTPFLPENRKPLWETPIIDPAVVAAERITANKALKPAQRLPALMIPAFGKATISGESIIQARDAARVFIALERYRLAHGAFPESLNALLPNFLDQVPPDRFDGKPIKYRLTDGKPVLYSIGSDLTDDHGTPMRSPTGELVRLDMHRESPVPGDWILFPPPRDPPTPPNP